MQSALGFLEGSPVQPWRWRALHVSFALFGIALLASSWRLWTPQLVFPQVPLVAWAGDVPQAAEWGLFIAALLSLAVSGAGQARRLPYVVFAFAMTLLFVIDQHRLQPWAFQFVVIALVLAALPPPRAFVLLRWLTVSIYLWSAVAKMDASFIQTLGQEFLAALVALVGASTENWSPAARAAGAWALPLSEVIVGLGYCLPLERWAWLRRIVLTLAVALHLVVMLLLSPLGLNHQPAVLLWNGWFIAQAILLFGFPASVGQASRLPESESTQRHWLGELSEVVVELLVAVVILLPALNLLDRYDHWLAWGLYAPRNSRALLYVPRDHVATIEAKRQKYLETSGKGDWVQWRLDKWSLDALAVPIYPQDRFQLGVAEAAIVEQHLEGRFRILLESPPDRWTGRRQQRTISTMRELHDAQAKYFFNARPRRLRPLEKPRTASIMTGRNK